jgi:hypothetical protein
MSHNVTQVANSLHNFTPNDYVSTRSEDRPHTIGIYQLLESIKYDDLGCDGHCSFRGELTVRWVNELINLGLLNTSAREYQRERVASVAWNQAIISTVLGSGYARVPEIHIRVVETEGEFKYEIVDGQQRLTAILGFIEGDFKTVSNLKTAEGLDIGNMSFKDIMSSRNPEVAHRMLDYPISCIWYVGLGDDDVGELFVEVLNNTNDMRVQEKINAIRSLFTTYIRETAREWSADDLTYKTHKLFERTVVKKKKRLVHMPAQPLKGRMEVDEWLTHLVYLDDIGPTKGLAPLKVLGWVKSKTRDGEFRDEARFRSTRKRADKLIQLALNLVKESDPKHRTGGPRGESLFKPLVLMMMTLYCNQQKKKGIRIDCRQFADTFFDIYDKWSDKKLYSKFTLLNGEDMVPFKTLFGGKNAQAIQNIFRVLDLELDQRGNEEFGFGVTIDSRDFSTEQIHQKLKDQNGFDFYTGKKLSADQAVGDHFIPRSWGKERGGVTEYSNLVVTSRYHNQQKLNMHGEDYRRMLKMKVEAA